MVSKFTTLIILKYNLNNNNSMENTDSSEFHVFVKKLIQTILKSNNDRFKTS